MTASTLAVLATILALGQFDATIDRGTQHGLAVGDRGILSYELRVDGATRRVDAGTVRVARADEATARVELASGKVLRPGFQVEFRIPSDRVSNVMSGSPAHGGLPASEVRRTAPPAEPAPRFAGTLLIAEGLYEIGLDREQAEFFNQTPAFSVQLESFLIDKRPLTRDEYLQIDPDHVFPPGDSEYATALTFDEVSALCRARGMRLPTEFEWEVGVRETGRPRPSAFYEWTRSWYLPYPGNERPEDAYGRRYRTVKGGTEASGWDSRRRGYLEPGVREPTVTFRCAGPFEPAGN